MRIGTSWARLFRLAFWLGVVGLVMVSLTPGKMLPRIQHDLLYHGLSYFGLAVLAALGHDRDKTKGMAFIGLVALGMAIELAQQFVPGRSASVADVLANASGVCAVVFLWWLYRLSRRDSMSGH